MKERRNVRRSKRLIREAFAELAKKTGDIEKISVKEIVDLADISKSTFYAHYDDVYAVAEEFEQEIITTINDSINDYFHDQKRDFKLYSHRLFLMFKENEVLYRKLFKLDHNNRFVNMIKKMIRNELSEHLPQELNIVNPKEFSFYLSFFTNGMADIVVDYFRDNLNLTLEEITENANSMLESLIKYINKELNNIKKRNY